MSSIGIVQSGLDYMGVSKNNGKTPKSSIKKLVFSIIFTIHFGNTHIER